MRYTNRRLLYLLYFTLPAVLFHAVVRASVVVEMYGKFSTPHHLHTSVSFILYFLLHLKSNLFNIFSRAAASGDRLVVFYEYPPGLIVDRCADVGGVDSTDRVV